MLKNFSPSWFSSVMGTGIVAISCVFFSKYFSFLKDISLVLFWFNVILCAVFLILWIARWIFYPQNAKDDLLHPVICAFYPTIAIAFLVIAGGFIVIVHDFKLAEICWFVGVILTIIFSFLIPLILFSNQNMNMSYINPCYYIPPVGLMVIPIAGAFFEPLSSGTTREMITLINFFGFGAGFFLYIALHALIIHRLILHDPLPSKLVPTLWINLGPIGAGSIALINIVSKTSFITEKEPFYMGVLMFWSFGLWWLVMVILITAKYIKKAELSYSSSWWAFIFPLGAFAASAHLVSKTLNMEIIDLIGFYIFCLLLFIWLLTFAFTLKSILATLLKSKNKQIYK